MKCWFTCTIASNAPMNDTQLIGDLKKFRSINCSIADEVLDKLSNHLWFLSDILVGLWFFDPRHNENTLLKMVAALNNRPEEKKT